MKILSYSKGEDAQDLLNAVITCLINMGLVVAEDGAGYQECCSTTHDFEIHVIKKR